jgi:hypothetical protein
VVARLVAEHHGKLARSGGKWTVPVGGGPGKAFRLGDQAMKLDLDAYYNAVKPKADNDTWLVQVTLTLVFPK